MSHNYWLIILFVATMVCNGNCRPREVDLTNNHPVYRSIKQVELETPNRYENTFKKEQNEDSLTYVRIGIPLENAKNNQKRDKLFFDKYNDVEKDIEYIPVSIAIKKTNLKKWPSDQNGIESPEDLSLYNTYVNNIKPADDEATNQNHDFSSPTEPSIFIMEELTLKPNVQTNTKPSIFIVEEITSRKPSFNYQNNHFSGTVFKPLYSKPAQASPPALPMHVSTSEPPFPSFTEQNSFYVPFTVAYTSTPRPIHVSYKPTIPPLPLYSAQVNFTHPESQLQTTPKPFHQNHHPGNIKPIYSILSNTSPSSPRPESTTKKQKKSKCPQVAVVATDSVYNNIAKESCQDINIYINNNINNTNNVLIKPTSTTGTVATLQSDPQDSQEDSVHSILDVIWSAINWLEKPEDNSTIFIAHATQPVTETSEFDVKSGSTVQKSKVNIESIATVARASSNEPSPPSPAAIGHFIDTVSQMVDSDMRTPPKLKEILKEKNGDRRETLSEQLKPMPVTFVYDDNEGQSVKISNFDGTEKIFSTDASEGKASNADIKVVMNEGVKGIAIPVVMDDEELETIEPVKKLQKIPEVTKPIKEEKKKNGHKTQAATTPSSGLSTWILLSDNKDVTTPSTKKMNTNGHEEKKKVAGGVSTTKKSSKIQVTTTQKTPTSNKKTTSKPTGNGTKKPETDTSATSALEAMVKNQIKYTTTTSKPKRNDSKISSQKKNQSDSKRKTTQKTELAETKDKVEMLLPSTKTVNTLPTHFVLTTEETTALSSTESNNASTLADGSVENVTKKKKSSTKKKKKNKKKKKPENGVEAKIPNQAVGSQIYNFLSREIVPTVGLGLIGVALTAGLASFLGYNPFISTTVPLRRTYDTNHGYSSSNYYNYNTDYGDGGQSEEVLLREVLSGMPEESRYGLTHADSTYSKTYNRKDQSYDNIKSPVYSTPTGSGYNSDKDTGSYESGYPQEYSYSATYDTTDKKYNADFKEKYPVYTRETGSSFVYPETTGMTLADKSSRLNSDYATKISTKENYGKSNLDTIERQPEALYRVANEADLSYGNSKSNIQGITNQNNWHRIGTPMDSMKIYSRVEPGPRNLDLTKQSKTHEQKRRVKRDVGDHIQRIARKRTKKESDLENEIDLDDSISSGQKSEDQFDELSAPVKVTTIQYIGTSGATTEKTTFSIKHTIEENTSTTTEDKKYADDSTEPYPMNDGDSGSVSSSASVLDVLKRLAQFKLRLGLNFLRSTTDLFSRYLDAIQKKVDESFTNTTMVQYNRKKSPWSSIFFGNKNDNGLRKKRSALEENEFLTSLLANEEKQNERFSKSTKKDLKLWNKMFHFKKSVPKKYGSKDGH